MRMIKMNNWEPWLIYKLFPNFPCKHSWILRTFKFEGYMCTRCGMISTLRPKGYK